MNDEVFDEVLVSPLARARQTAEPVLAALGRDEKIDPWLEEIRDPGWHGTPAERAEQAYREMRERPVDGRWAGLEGGESVREFTDRIRLGASLFLAERGIHRIEHDLPVWQIDEPERADRARSPMPAPTRSSSATCWGSSRHRGSGTASCSVTPR